MEAIENVPNSASLSRVMGPPTLRNLILVLLVAQTTAIVLLMRYSRSVVRHPDDGPRFRTTIAVFLSEALKLPVCLAMCARVVGIGELKVLLRNEVTGHPDTLKCALPALAYTVQNNLLFVALSKLSAPVFQASSPSTTALSHAPSH